MLILLGGVVAHEVNGVLPDFSPHVHSWTRVHGTAHPVGGCPDELRGGKHTKRVSTCHYFIYRRPILQPRFLLCLLSCRGPGGTAALHAICKHIPYSAMHIFTIRVRVKTNPLQGHQSRWREQLGVEAERSEGNYCTTQHFSASCSFPEF